jgi:hypothetical protein
LDHRSRVCVCVRERERECDRERGTHCLNLETATSTVPRQVPCVGVCVCVCVRVCVCDRERVRHCLNKERLPLLLEQGTASHGEEKKRKSSQFTTDQGTRQQKSALGHEARTRAWQERVLGIQNKTDTTAILALA